MTDNHDTRTRDWHGVLTALPDEPPPHDGWARLSRALDDATPSRVSSRRRWSLAIAATLALLAPVLALRMADRKAEPVPAAAIAPRVPEPLRTQSASGRMEADRSAASTAAEPANAHAVALTDTPREANVDVDARVSNAVAPSKRAAAGAVHGRTRSGTSVHGASTRDVASAARIAGAEQDPATPVTNSGLPDASPASSRGAAARGHGSRPTIAAMPGGRPGAHTHVDPLQALYTESAQLETLLVLTRDDRVSSATGAALSDALAGHLVSLDAELGQPGLPDTQRSALWRERVATLRQLAGIESTERWLAVHGRAYGDAFVRVD